MATDRHLFFSDIAFKIDAVDIDANAIKYAQRHFRKENIHYHHSSVVDFLNSRATIQYDVIYFGAGYDYFTKSEREHLFQGISKVLAPDGVLVIKTPVWDKEKYMTNQQEAKYDFAQNPEQLLAEIQAFFNVIQQSVIEYNSRTESVLVVQRL